MTQPLIASADAHQASNDLRTRGYAYLPGLLAAEAGHAREDVLVACHDIGLTVRPGDDRAPDGRRGRLGTAWFAEGYPSLQRLESFHQLGSAAPLVSLVAEVLGDDVFCHPARVCRVVLPTTTDIPFGTEPHQDYVKLVIEPDVLTAWVALTDCDERRQGVRILPDSHRGGLLEVDPSMGRSLPVYLSVPVEDPRWATAPFAVGDVVLFHSLTVHGGGPNTTTRLRLSAELRFQRVSNPILAEHTRPHGWPRVPDWPELTRGWDSTRWCEVPDGVEVVDRPSSAELAEVRRRGALPVSALLRDSAGSQ